MLLYLEWSTNDGETEKQCDPFIATREQILAQIKSVKNGKLKVESSCIYWMDGSITLNLKTRAYGKDCYIKGKAVLLKDKNIKAYKAHVKCDNCEKPATHPAASKKYKGFKVLDLIGEDCVLCDGRYQLKRKLKGYD